MIQKLNTFGLLTLTPADQSIADKLNEVIEELNQLKSAGPFLKKTI